MEELSETCTRGPRSRVRGMLYRPRISELTDSQIFMTSAMIHVVAMATSLALVVGYFRLAYGNLMVYFDRILVDRLTPYALFIYPFIILIIGLKLYKDNGRGLPMLGAWIHSNGCLLLMCSLMMLYNPLHESSWIYDSFEDAYHGHPLTFTASGLMYTAFVALSLLYLNRHSAKARWVLASCALQLGSFDLLIHRVLV